MALKIGEFYLTNEETEAQDIKWLVPKHTSQSVAKQQPGPQMCRSQRHAPSYSLQIQGPAPGPRHLSCGLGPTVHHQTKTRRSNGLCFLNCSGSQHFMHSYSNVSFQPDIEMLLKNYIQDPRENIFTSNQRGLGSCHKRQYRESVGPGLPSVLNKD